MADLQNTLTVLAILIRIPIVFGITRSYSLWDLRVHTGRHGHSQSSVQEIGFTLIYSYIYDLYDLYICLYLCHCWVRAICWRFCLISDSSHMYFAIVGATKRMSNANEMPLSMWWSLSSVRWYCLKGFFAPLCPVWLIAAQVAAVKYERIVSERYADTQMRMCGALLLMLLTFTQLTHCFIKLVWERDGKWGGRRGHCLACCHLTWTFDVFTWPKTDTPKNKYAYQHSTGRRSCRSANCSI